MVIKTRHCGTVLRVVVALMTSSNGKIATVKVWGITNINVYQM